MIAASQLLGSKGMEVQEAIGIEKVANRVALARATLEDTLTKHSFTGRVSIHQTDIETMASLPENTTIVYSFATAFPPVLVQRIHALCMKCPSLRAIVVTESIFSACMHGKGWQRWRERFKVSVPMRFELSSKDFYILER